MKKLTAITAALVAATSFASAEELSISSTFAWESDYVFRGVGLAEETFMPAIDISYGAFYAGAWAALSADEVGNEVDFYLGYGLDVSETVGLDFGYTYYTYPSAQSDLFDNDVNSSEFYVGANFALPLSPSIYVFYDVDYEVLTVEGSVGYSFELSEDSAIDVSGYLGNTDPDAGASNLYYGAGVAYNYSFTDSASISVFSNYYGSENDTIFGDDYEISYGFSFTAGF